jgi:hypothetical protein
VLAAALRERVTADLLEIRGRFSHLDLRDKLGKLLASRTEDLELAEHVGGLVGQPDGVRDQHQQPGQRDSAEDEDPGHPVTLLVGADGVIVAPAIRA